MSLLLVIIKQLCSQKCQTKCNKSNESVFKVLSIPGVDNFLPVFPIQPVFVCGRPLIVKQGNRQETKFLLEMSTPVASVLLLEAPCHMLETNERNAGLPLQNHLLPEFSTPSINLTKSFKIKIIMPIVSFAIVSIMP